MNEDPVNTLIETDVKHVWKGTGSEEGLFWWTDEASLLYGPYDNIERAKYMLDMYVKTELR